MADNRTDVKERPRGNAGERLQLFGSENTACFYDSTISSASTLTLNTKSTLIEITALGGALWARWGGSATNTGDIKATDILIAENTTRVIPVKKDETQITFIEKGSGAEVFVREE